MHARSIGFMGLYGAAPAALGRKRQGRRPRGPPTQSARPRGHGLAQTQKPQPKPGQFCRGKWNFSILANFTVAVKGLSSLSPQIHSPGSQAHP
jgi:hypothetical protein